MTHNDSVISICWFFLPVSIMGEAGFGRSRNKVKGDFKGG